MAEYDFVFIGGGHNALTCAAYLAKTGAEVALFEKDNVVGGACRTQELTLPGFKHNVGSVVHTNIPVSPVYRDLELHKYGVKYIYPEYPRATIFTDHRSLLMYRDPEKMAEEISKYSHRDADTYLKLYRDYYDFFEKVYVTWMYTPPSSPAVFYSMLEEAEGGDKIIQWMHMSAADLLNEFFESEEVKVHFLTRFTVLGFAPHHYGLGLVALFRIFKAEAPICVGGSYSLARGLQLFIEKHGGKIFTNTPVKKIVVKNAKAEGIILNDGRYVGAKKAIISGLEPKTTYLSLIGAEHLSEDFVKRVKNYHSYGRSLFCIHLALDHIPNYKAASRKRAVNKAFSQEIFGDTIQQQLEVYHEIALGIPPKKEALQITVPTIYDVSQAPPNKHTAVIWQYAPYKLQNARWNDIREKYAEDMLHLWSNYLSEDETKLILAMKIQGPTDTERIFPNLLNGVDVVGDMTPDQFGYLRPFIGFSQYRGPIEKIYHAGGYCHPGGGVHGGAGYNCANILAQDFGLLRWWAE